MNILVSTPASPGGCDRITARIDTTVDKENTDIYTPEDVIAMDWCPALFARICKAGKAVRADFADRYYDSIAFGALLYPRTEAGRDMAERSCYDHSTLLPYPLYNKITLEAADNVFEMKKNGTVVASYNCEGIKQSIERAIVECSERASLRIGDFVALELGPMQELATRSEGDCTLVGSFCGNSTIDIKINF